MTKHCVICSALMDRVFSATVLRRYEADYYQCAKCGLLQVAAPYWLDEAYRNPIADSDTGLIQRNLSLAAKLSTVLYFCVEPRATYLDVAGGYGMLTRVMRDIGFDFYWSDKHCENVLARGFERSNAERKFAALTAFEVLEHVADPVAFLSSMLTEHGVRTIIFSTQTYSGDLPDKDWWYFAFETGQHISFYQTRTLATLAKRLGLQFLSANGLHILTDDTTKFANLKLLTGKLAFPAAVYIRHRLGSRTLSDHVRLMRPSEKQRSCE